MEFFTNISTHENNPLYSISLCVHAQSRVKRLVVFVHHSSKILENYSSNWLIWIPVWAVVTKCNSILDAIELPVSPGFVWLTSLLSNWERHRGMRAHWSFKHISHTLCKGAHPGSLGASRRVWRCILPPLCNIPHCTACRFLCLLQFMWHAVESLCLTQLMGGQDWLILGVGHEKWKCSTEIGMY